MDNGKVSDKLRAKLLEPEREVPAAFAASGATKDSKKKKPKNVGKEKSASVSSAASAEAPHQPSFGASGPIASGSGQPKASIIPHQSSSSSISPFISGQYISSAMHNLPLNVRTDSFDTHRRLSLPKSVGLSPSSGSSDSSDSYSSFEASSSHLGKRNSAGSLVPLQQHREPRKSADNIQMNVHNSQLLMRKRHRSNTTTINEIENKFESSTTRPSEFTRPTLTTQRSQGDATNLNRNLYQMNRGQPTGMLLNRTLSHTNQMADFGQNKKLSSDLETIDTSHLLSDLCTIPLTSYVTSPQITSHAQTTSFESRAHMSSAGASSTPNMMFSPWGQPYVNQQQVHSEGHILHGTVTQPQINTSSNSLKNIYQRKDSVESKVGGEFRSLTLMNEGQTSFEDKHVTLGERTLRTKTEVPTVYDMSPRFAGQRTLIKDQPTFYDNPQISSGVRKLNYEHSPTSTRTLICDQPTFYEHSPGSSSARDSPYQTVPEHNTSVSYSPSVMAYVTTCINTVANTVTNSAIVNTLSATLPTVNAFSKFTSAADLNVVPSSSQNRNSPIPSHTQSSQSKKQELLSTMTSQKNMTLFSQDAQQAGAALLTLESDMIVPSDNLLPTIIDDLEFDLDSA